MPVKWMGVTWLNPPTRIERLAIYLGWFLAWAEFVLLPIAAATAFGYMVYRMVFR